MRSLVFLLSILLQILQIDQTSSDWVDMPQFSDDTRVYRIPSGEREHFYKFTRHNGDNYFYQRNNSRPYEEDTKSRYPFNEESHDYQIAKPTETFTRDFINLGDYEETSETYTENSRNIETTTEDEITITEEEPDSDESLEETDNNSFYQEEPQEYQNETRKMTNGGILDHLPIDILKQVHRTLKSQPVTLEGKMRFLRSFERTLMTEIESRLAATLHPKRGKRGASDHYDHGYDDHEDHGLGFPSIEGALMAISFLTFAVYLVRLVMLLFRNMNNTPTTTGPTLFLGKRRRSVDQINEDTIRILNNVERFSQTFS